MKIEFEDFDQYGRERKKSTEVTYFTGGNFTHPDYALLVDPLCFAKRVRRIAKPSAQRREGG
jgi:hypothetical protein